MNQNGVENKFSLFVLDLLYVNDYKLRRNNFWVPRQVRMILYHMNLLCKNFVFLEYVCSSKQCQINNIISFEVCLNNIHSVASSNCKQTHEESSYKRASYLNLFSKRSKFYVQTICPSSVSKYFAKKLKEASGPAETKSMRQSVVKHLRAYEVASSLWS